MLHIKLNNMKGDKDREAMVVFRFAYKLTEHGIPFSLEKIIPIGENNKARVDLVTYDKDNNIISIVEFKGYNTIFKTESERESRWKNTRQYRKYSKLTKNLYYVGGPVSFERAIEEIIKLHQQLLSPIVVIKHSC